MQIWGFPKIRGTILGVPIVRTIVFGECILGFPYFGKLPYRAVILAVSPCNVLHGACDTCKQDFVAR